MRLVRRAGHELRTFFQSPVGNGVRARGGRARGLGEGGGDFFLANGEVIRIGGEVDVGECGGRRGREEVFQEGRVDTFRGVFVRERGKAGLLAAKCELFGFPYRGRGEGR